MNIKYILREVLTSLERGGGGNATAEIKVMRDFKEVERILFLIDGENILGDLKEKDIRIIINIRRL